MTESDENGKNIQLATALSEVESVIGWEILWSFLE